METKPMLMLVAVALQLVRQRQVCFAHLQKIPAIRYLKFLYTMNERVAIVATVLVRVQLHRPPRVKRGRRR